MILKPKKEREAEEKRSIKFDLAYALFKDKNIFIDDFKKFVTCDDYNGIVVKEITLKNVDEYYDEKIKGRL